MVRKNENVFFHKHFLNMDISFNSQYKALKFETCIYGLQMEGSVSQFCYLGPSFYSMQCRNLYRKKWLKVTLF